MNMTADAPGAETPEPPLGAQTIEDTGLTRPFLVELVARVMYRRGADKLSAISRITRLSGAVVAELMEGMRTDRLIAPLGQLGGDMRSEMRYELTEKGRAWALEAIARLDYTGPAPVPLDQFKAMIASQSVRSHRVGRDQLARAFGDLVIPEGMLDRLGPAVNSGRSILLYGPPGNGKSSYAHALTRALGGEIYVPHAVEVGGEVILFFDPTVHTPLEPLDVVDQDELDALDGADLRYIRCRRPAVVTGAELTVAMLDLSFNPTTRVYQAPLHMKASNGVMIIDDMGRQRETPQQFINRMVVPMEEGVDYLNLQSGLSFQVPFDALLIFSTNIPPQTLVDSAGLRRIYYKILVDRPTREDFIKIFLRVARRYKVEATEEVLAHLLNTLYPKAGIGFAGYHAPYLIDQALAACDYLGERRALRVPHINAAWDNLHVDENA
ncbi:ATPase [Rhodovulum sp. DZ06]|uniref:ATPase n=1 Tax=Rhodovulum sp. DZ06 TaxID=3425126 RepID=UPI003D334C19